MFFAIVFITDAKAQMRFKHFGTDDGLSQTCVNSFMQDRKAYIWIATQDGLNRFDGINFTIYRNNSKDTNSVADNFVVNLSTDTSGKIIACCRHGMSIQKNQSTFANFYFDPLGRKSFHKTVNQIVKNKNRIHCDLCDWSCFMFIQ